MHFMLAVNNAYLYALFMRNATPFFQAFGPLLFGKPPVSALAEAFAKFSECSSLSQLRKAFGSYIPRALLDRRPSGKEPSINKGSNLACTFGLWLRCSSVTEALAMLLRRALPEAKIPAPSCHLNFLTAPKVREAKLGTVLYGKSRKRALLTTRAKRRLRCSSLHPIHVSRECNRREAAQKTRTPSHWPSWSKTPYQICSPTALMSLR